MEKNKKALLIVNPRAGRTKSRAGTFEIVDKFSSSEYEFAVHTTTCQGDATNIVKRELKDHDLVVCCGGDGTLNETINGVMDMPRRVPIGYIPAGTTNDLANSLSIPTGIKEATELIINGQPNDYDIGLFNNRYYSYVASFGAFSRASYVTSQKAKNTFGRAAYIAAGVADVKNIKNIRMRVEYDGGVIEDNFVFGTVSNSLSVGGFIKLPDGTVKFNDGKFEVILVRNFKLHKLLPLMHKVINHQYDGKQIIMFSTNKIKFTALDEDIPWTIDGEFAGSHRDVMIHVLERAVEIYSPQTDHFLPKPVVTVESEKEEKEDWKTRIKRNKAEREEAKADKKAEKAKKLNKNDESQQNNEPEIATQQDDVAATVTEN